MPFSIVRKLINIIILIQDQIAEFEVFKQWHRVQLWDSDFSLSSLSDRISKMLDTKLIVFSKFGITINELPKEILIVNLI